MFVVRFFVLAFLVAYGFGMGQTRPDELNALGKIISASFFISAPALYLLPTFEAWHRGHQNLGAIAAVNAFLGWSLLGWVVALAWAFRKVEQPASTDANQSEQAAPPEQARETKMCPFCAEEILSAAIKCKHCGSSVSGC